MKAKAKRAAPAGARVLLRPIGVIRSVLETRAEAPKQGREGAPDAWLEVRPWAAEGLRGIAAGDEIIVITWLHRARRDVLRVHPRSNRRRPLTGVFATRSPDQPNRALLEEGAGELLAKETLADAELQALLRRVVTPSLVPVGATAVRPTVNSRGRRSRARERQLETSQWP